MKNKEKSFIKKIINNKTKRRRVTSVLLILAILVTSGVFSQLKFTGIAMADDAPASCGKEEHTHSEECMETTGHTHSVEEGCYTEKQKLNCEEFEYAHSEGCHKIVETLDCEEEHEHTEPCYIEESVLICEDKEHTHDDSCYEKEQITNCSLQESIDYQYICDKEEHRHTDECFVDKTADVETVAISEKAFGNPIASGDNFTLYENTEKDAFIKDPTYAKFYAENHPLGTAGSFHIVSFDTADLQAHTNGNILANNLKATSSNFGTNNYGAELSYAVNYNPITASSGAHSDSYLAIGSGNTTGTADNGNALTINGTKIDKPKNFVKDKNSSTAPFIDLARVEHEIRTISAKQGTIENQNIIANLTDMNNRSLTLTAPAGTAYYNITGSELDNISQNPLDMKGFKTGNDGTIVVNVDMANTATVTMPEAIMFVDDVKQNTNEVTTFENGKVIWNFINAEGATIETKRLLGTIIAPGATVNVNQNLNGSIIAKNVTIKAESHRTDFTGKLNPTHVPFDARKNVNDKIPTSAMKFNFMLEKFTGGAWTKVETVQNEAEYINFTDISYNSSGDFWYRITEQRSTGYTWDDSEYIIKVEVKEPDLGKNQLTAMESYFKVVDKEKLIIDGEINEQALTSVHSKETFIFDNYEILPTKVNLSAKKYVDNQVPDANTNFDFTLSKLTGGTWEIIQRKANNGENITFDVIDISESGTHWCLLQEEKMDIDGYSFDETQYIVKVTVEENKGQLTSTLNYYRVLDPSDLIIIDEINDEALEGIHDADLIFNNTTEDSYELPGTGGTGTLIYVIWGFLLMVATLLYGYMRNKYERRVGN